MDAIAKKGTAEFRFLQIPSGEDVIAFLENTYKDEFIPKRQGAFSLVRHFHNLLEIGICRAGKGNICLENQKIPYSKGTVMIIPKNVSHCFDNTFYEQSQWEYIFVDPDEFLRESSKFGKRDIDKYVNIIEKHTIIRADQEVRLFVRELDCLMDQIRMQEYGYKNCVKGLLITLFMEIVKMCLEEECMQSVSVHQVGLMESGKLKLAIEFVEDHFEENIKISDIAEAAFISESYLRKLFTQNYHMSPLQYVNLIRVNKACTLLGKKGFNIGEVARKVGFENTSTFIMNFKKVMGETPKQWVKEAVKPGN